MTRYKIKYSLLLAAMALTACQNTPLGEEPEDRTALSDVEIEVSLIARSEGDDAGDSSDNLDSNLDNLDYYFVEGRSVLFISQRGNTLSLNFEDVTASGEPNLNLYKYTYYRNPSANWEIGTNFYPYSDNSLNWERIRHNALGNTYAFGALYYPVENEIRNAVKIDQSALNDYRKSDVLGAWHTTDEYQSRLRFRLYHLMACLHVTVLVPVWNQSENTGYGPEAIDDALALGLRPEFTINWPERTSEERPAPQASGDPQDLRMYRVETSSDSLLLADKFASLSEEARASILSRLELTEEQLNTEYVREYTYQVLFPTQNPSAASALLRFYLTTMNQVKKSYSLYLSDLATQITLPAATQTNLVLFLPRKDNHAILVKSTIEDWIDAETEFIVTPETNEEDDETED